MENKHKTLSDILWEAGLFDEPIADEIFEAVKREKKQALTADRLAHKEELERLLKKEEDRRDYDGNDLQSACDYYHIAAENWAEIIRFQDGYDFALAKAKDIISEVYEK